MVTSVLTKRKPKKQTDLGIADYEDMGLSWEGSWTGWIVDVVQFMIVAQWNIWLLRFYPAGGKGSQALEMGARES